MYRNQGGFLRSRQSMASMASPFINMTAAPSNFIRKSFIFILILHIATVQVHASTPEASSTSASTGQLPGSRTRSCSRSSPSVCILTKSRRAQLQLTSQLQEAIWDRCSACIQLSRLLTKCDDDSDGVIYFSPPSNPSFFHLDKWIRRNRKVVAKISVGTRRNRIPPGARYRPGRALIYHVKNRRAARRFIPRIANSFCRALSRTKKVPSPRPSSSPTPSPSVSSVLIDFNDGRNPRFNLEVLQLLFDLFVEEELGDRIETLGDLIEFNPADVRTPSASPSPSCSPSPSPAKKRPYPSHPLPSPSYYWRQLNLPASMHQVTQVCRRANCAARVTVISQRFIRFAIINNALNQITRRPTFRDVFNTDRSLYRVTRVGNNRFVVIIPFNNIFLAEF